MKPWFLAAMLLVARIASAQQTDILRGRVTGPDSLPVQGVEVRATSYLGNIVKTAATGKDGRYMLVFINGEGDYWLDFRKLGLAPKRFELKRIGDEEVLIGDTRMTSTIQQLDAVSVTSQRDRALPNRTSNPDVGGGEKPITNNMLSPDQAGNLAAMAAAVAGIQMVPGFDGAADMFTLLGLTGDQNNTTFNGLGSAISALPPDILATTSIVPYSFDPSIGGFSGAQIAIRTIPGSNFSRRALSSAGSAPSLEWADATAAAQGQKYTSMRIGGNAAGPIVEDNLFYNTAYNFQRRFSDARTLLNTDAAGLAAAGIAADSVERLRSILAGQGIPLGGAPSVQAQNLAQLTGNMDWMPSASGAGHSFVFGGAGSYQQSQSVSRGGLLLATPSHAGESSFWGANTTILHSNYFWFGILEKTTLGAAISGSTGEPYVALPEGTVRVGSSFPDGTSSLKPVFFAGNSTSTSQQSRTVQLNNQLSWFTADNAHTIKLTSGIAYDGFRADASSMRLGSFSFNSLADLDAARPSSFTRTLAARTQSGSQIIGTASLGDYWRPTQNVQLQYGVRLDVNRFLSAPAFNAAVLDTFGLRNDAVPNRAYLSPRVGLQWYYGSSPQIAYAPGAARPPRAVIHAGVGLFQNMAASQLISSATLATGLPSSTQTLSCVGAAVPFPDWSAFITDASAIPSHCADGSAGSVFASGAPSVTLFDAHFRQPHSIRGAADWSSPVLDNRFVLGLQTVISTGIDQQGFVDANVNRTARFTLGDEASRPVFADAAAIVPSTGVIAAGAARVSPAFQRVTLDRSDLRVDARQVSVNLKPVTANPYLKWDFTYTLLDAHERVNGFSSAAGDPFERYWTPRQMGGRHTIMAQWSDVPLFDLMYVSVRAVAMSGQRYTPTVAGDVNGDGYQNDRAFVFDPATTADASLAAGMRAMLANGTSSARDCLLRQLGTIASRGSCRAPWTVNNLLEVKFNPQKIGLPKRLRVVLDVQNPLGVADLALHGSDGIHGWGMTIPPDQNLLFVRGFDPMAKRFIYDVNQRFGSTRPQQSSVHTMPYLSLTFGLDIGVPRERQLLTQRLDIGRAHEGTKLGPESMKLLGTTTIPNPMNMIMQQQDSLHLTRGQADSLATLSYRFSLFTDSVWTPASKRLAALPDTYDRGAAYGEYVRARERTIDFLMSLVPGAKGVLTSSQRRRLPPQIANYMDERVLRFLRSSSAGDGSPTIIR